MKSEIQKVNRQPKDIFTIGTLVICTTGDQKGAIVLVGQSSSHREYFKGVALRSSDYNDSMVGWQTDFKKDDGWEIFTDKLVLENTF